MEAIKNGNDHVAELLSKEGASLKVENAGSFLCAAVSRGDADLIKRLLLYGIDPNTKDYDFRTPLHIAASSGLTLMAKLLLEYGGSVFSKDRYPNTTYYILFCFPVISEEHCPHWYEVFWRNQK